jgi:septum site-determining protein MinD
VNIAEESGTDVTGVVVNKVQDREDELDADEIESMLGHGVLAEIPDDPAVRESLSVKKPVIHHEPEHHVSERFKGVAADMAGLQYEPDISGPGLLDRIKERINGL